ncbi:MAG: hypothetical protein N3G78_09895 [Desulfobacterota bacterium]|nr:hypothetical protein [Thermodesulfobacteriota bacterium]
MNAIQARDELRKMGIRDLFRLAADQKLSECLVGARACSLYLKYRGYPFCLSELLGKGCIYEERLKRDRISRETPHPLLFPAHRLSPVKTEGIPFKVYWRDESTRAMIFLGEVVERRTKERKNNLQDLLIKARKEFSHRVENPAGIFLLGP